MNATVTDLDRENARGIAQLFGGNGLCENQQVELVAQKLAEIRTRPPRDAGRAAYLAGRPLNANPHPPGRQAHQQWAAGHVAAEIDTPPHVLALERAFATVGASIEGEPGAWQLVYPTPLGTRRFRLEAFDHDCALAEAWKIIRP